MSELYCLYSDGGVTVMKTRQGDAVAAFSTPELAQTFTGHFPPLSRKEIIPLSALGHAEHPWDPITPFSPFLQILFSSEDLIAKWAADKEHFDTAPHVSRIATPGLTRRCSESLPGPRFHF